MDESLADEEVTEVAYVLDEDAEEIFDIGSNDVDDDSGTGYDNDHDNEDTVADMTTEDLGALNLAGNSNDELLSCEMDDSVAQSDAVMTFTNHTGSVFCINLSSRKSLAVTGGEDDVAYVWNVPNGDIVFKCTGHKDSVVCAAFNHDSDLVATGDMAGLIKVWSVDSQQEVWSYEVDDLEWLRWHHSSSVLLAGTGSGDTWMWLVPTTSCKTFAGHGARCTVGEILHDGKRACVGYADGTLKLLDLKSGTSVFTLAAGKPGHEDEVTCIDCHSSDNLLITGSVDCTALLVNVRTGKVVHRFVCGDPSRRPTSDEDHMNDDSDAAIDSVEAVGFSTSYGYVATATHFGLLTVWETGSFNMRHQCKHDAGVIRLRWDTERPVVYTCTEAGAVHSWDARTGIVLHTWLGHAGNVLDMDITSDWLVTAGDDHTARVFSLKDAVTLQQQQQSTS